MSTGDIYYKRLKPGTFPSTWYWADVSFYAKTVSVAADRYKLLTPNAIQIDIGGSSYTLSAQATLDLSQEATWDTVSGTDYRTASNRAGKDFYVYAVQPVSGTVPAFKVSANSTVPSGYDAGTSRKVSGFHCLCVSMSTPASRANSTAYAIGYTVQPATPNGYWYRSACNKMWAASTAFSSGDLVMAKLGSQNIYECTTAGTSAGSAPTWPDSGTVSDYGVVWTYRGAASTTTSLVSGGSPPTFGTTVGGFTRDGNVQWLCEAEPATKGYVQGDIIPNSVWDLKSRAANGNNAGMAYVDAFDDWVDIYFASGTGAATASVYNATISDTRNWMDFNDDARAVKKRMLRDAEFQKAAFGSNEETNITGSADPVTAGGHSDMFGRRMVSNYFLEDCCGASWQWLDEQSYRSDGADLASSQAWNWNDLQGSKGSHYRQGTYGDIKLLAGGHWSSAASAGSRARGASDYRWAAIANFGCRFAARSITK